MNSLKVLSIAAAMSLALAAPTAGFAQTKWSGPGGGGKVAVGGGGGGGAPIGGGGGFRAGGSGGGPMAGPVARAPGAGFGGGAAGPRFAAGSGFRGGHAGHRHHHHGGGGFVPGLVIGGALASSYAYYGSPGYYGSQYGYYDDGYYDDGAVAVAPGGDDVEYCRQRYRSYDLRTGTYLGNDGLRHACP